MDRMTVVEKIEKTVDMRYIKCVLEMMSLIRRRIDGWFRDDLADLIGSDMHNCTSRPMQMQAAYAALAQRYGSAAADELTGRTGSRWLETIKHPTIVA